MAWLKPPDYAIITPLFRASSALPLAPPPPPPPPLLYSWAPCWTPAGASVWADVAVVGRRETAQAACSHHTPGCLAAALRSPPPCYGGSPAANPSAHGAMATRAGLRMGRPLIVATWSARSSADALSQFSTAEDRAVSSHSVVALVDVSAPILSKSSTPLCAAPRGRTHEGCFAFVVCLVDVGTTAKPAAP